MGSTTYLISRRSPDLTDTAPLRKARGAFFTPNAMSRFIANWALRARSDIVLEPSAGEASFLIQAGARLKALGADRSHFSSALNGVELHAASAAEAKTLLGNAGFDSNVQSGDFFDVEPDARYDAVIGNPPYVRYHEFAGVARAKGMRAALTQGVRLTGLSSAWAPFTVHAARFLKPGGRLGLVLPAELLTVNYAAQVRRFLLERFARVRLVMFEELVFPGVLEEVVLLLAEGEGPAPSGSFEVFQAQNLEALEEAAETATWTWFTPEKDGKWTPALLASAALEAQSALSDGEGFETLATWGSTYLGVVTGNNAFFTLTSAQVRALGLKKRELLRISPPGSRHLRGLTFTDSAWEELADESAVYLFAPDVEKRSPEAQAYVKAGESMRVHTGYKCRMRSPWWRVPLVNVPDIFLTYMDHERPRAVTNATRALHLNSLYGISLRADRRKIGCDLLPLAMLNTATLLGAEMVGRAYGGGLLKLEPREADKLLVPSLATLREVASELRNVRPQIGTALRKGALQDAVAIVDRIVLSRHLGLPASTLKSLRTARDVLFSRRVARGGGKGRRAAD